VGVDLGRLAIRVPEELLDRPHRLPGGGETRSEGVAQIVETHRSHARVAARSFAARPRLRYSPVARAPLGFEPALLGSNAQLAGRSRRA
jgi:hypothetical protein